MSQLDFDLPAAQAFLSALAANNSLEWMHQHQPQYKHARLQFELLAQQFTDQLAVTESWLDDFDVKKRISRLNRDTRFSKDKSPYSPTFRIHISPFGNQPIPCGLFLCLSPDGLFLGAGLFASMFAEATAMIRTAIHEQPEQWRAVVESPEFLPCLPVRGESLKRVPKPFDPDDPLKDALKMKSWYLECPVFLDQKPENILETLIDLARRMQPFNAFLNQALAGFKMPER